MPQTKRSASSRKSVIALISGIREKAGLSQSQFAKLLGVSVRTLQDWEQGRRAPSGAARMLLLVAAKRPKTLLEVAR
jgi:putative transcriptional regulator